MYLRLTKSLRQKDPRLSWGFRIPVRDRNFHQKDFGRANAICAAHEMYLLLMALAAFCQVSHQQFLHPTAGSCHLLNNPNQKFVKLISPHPDFHKSGQNKASNELFLPPLKTVGSLREVSSWRWDFAQIWYFPSLLVQAQESAPQVRSFVTSGKSVVTSSQATNLSVCWLHLRFIVKAEPVQIQRNVSLKKVAWEPHGISRYHWSALGRRQANSYRFRQVRLGGK